MSLSLFKVWFLRLLTIPHLGENDNNHQPTVAVHPSALKTRARVNQNPEPQIKWPNKSPESPSSRHFRTSSPKSRRTQTKRAEPSLALSPLTEANIVSEKVGFWGSEMVDIKRATIIGSKYEKLKTEYQKFEKLERDMRRDLNEKERREIHHKALIEKLRSKGMIHTYLI